MGTGHSAFFTEGPHHGFTVLTFVKTKVPLEISVSTLVFTKVRTVFAVKKLRQCVQSLCRRHNGLTFDKKMQAIRRVG